MPGRSPTVVGVWLVSLALLVAGVAAYGDTWIPQVVGSVAMAKDGGLSLAVGSSGNVGLVYQGRTLTGAGQDLHYLSGDWTGTWNSVETLDSGAGTGAAGSLTYAGDVPYLSYRRQQGLNDYALAYANESGGAWTTGLAYDAAGMNPRHTVARLDANGLLTIAYVDETTNPLNYASLNYAADNGTTWWQEQIDPRVRLIGGVGLGLPGANTAGQVAYANEFGTQRPPSFTERSGGAWTAPTVLNAGDRAAYMSMALDGQQRPVLAWMDTSTSMVRMAAWNGSAWVVRDVVSLAPNTAWSDYDYLDLAVDDWGFAHFLYYDPAAVEGGVTGAVRYVNMDLASGATTLALTLSTGASYWMNLTIGPEERPLFAFYRDSDQSVYYGVGDPAPIPEPTTLALLLVGLGGLAWRRRRRPGAGVTKTERCR